MYINRRVSTCFTVYMPTAIICRYSSSQTDVKGSTIIGAFAWNRHSTQLTCTDIYAFLPSVAFMRKLLQQPIKSWS